MDFGKRLDAALEQVAHIEPFKLTDRWPHLSLL
jgi:hypothetical protein